MSHGFSIGFTDVVSAFKTAKLMKNKWIASRSANRYIHKLPDHLLVHIFSFLNLHELNRCFRVCKKWLEISRDPRLWTRLSLRPEYSGYDVTRPGLIVHLVRVRFSSNLTYLELPDTCIVPHVLHEVANRCPSLRHMTLDFSRAVQLRDFSELISFPCSLISLTICLSDVIFMEGFMKKIYQHLNSITCLHLIGTYELEEGNDPSEVFEVLNISKLKNHTPHLTVINMYGVCFLDDSHVDVLSSNCVNLRCLALNFCVGVKGGSFGELVRRCPRLDTLLLQQCALEDCYVEKVPWSESSIRELDISSSDLSSSCLIKILCQMKQITYLAVSHCEFFTDEVLHALTSSGRLNNIRAIDLSHTTNLSEASIKPLLLLNKNSLEGLMLGGKKNLSEQFFLDVIAFLPKIRIFVCGFSNSWFLRTNMKVLIDNIIFALTQNCPQLCKLEIQWDGDSLRYSESSNKFINQLRLRCPRIQSITLADGEYYELVKSNFERAGRMRVVRTTRSHETSIARLLFHYKQLLFN